MSIYDLVLNGKKGLRSRYFRRNEGTTDYATSPNITMDGDVVIEFDINAPPQDDNNALSFRNIGALNTFGLASGRDLQGNTAKMRVFSSSVPVVDEATTMDVFDNIFHTVRFEYTLSTTSFKLFIDGVEGISTTSLGTDFSATDVMTVWRDITTGDEMAGIIANLKIYDSGVLKYNWPINSNSTTETDTVSGAVLTIVNGNADDWGLYQKQAAGEWLGQDLVVNGGFDTSSDWDVFDGWGISSGIASRSGNTRYSNIEQSGVLRSLGTYKLTYDVVSILEYNLKMNKVVEDVDLSGSVGVGFTASFTAATVDLALRAGGGSGGGYCSIDNVMVREVLNVA